MNPYLVIILIVFGVLGLSWRILFRLIYLWSEFEEGNEVNWKLQMFLTFAEPVAYLIVMVELMWALGIFVVM
jgi:hypothetical protein